MRSGSRIMAMMAGAAIALASATGLAGRNAPIHAEPGDRFDKPGGGGRGAGPDPSRKAHRQQFTRGTGRSPSGRSVHIDYQRQASLRRRMGGNAMARRMAARGFIWNDAAGCYQEGRNRLTEALYPPHMTTTTGEPQP